MLYGMILFDYHILYMIEYKLCPVTKINFDMWLNKILVIFTKYYIIADVPWYARMGPDPACNIGLIPVRFRHNVTCLHGSD